MLPFMAQGHLIPFLSLAHLIYRRHGFIITIATTPVNARYLRTAVGDDKHHQIHVSELPFTSADHDLQPDVENTESLPLNQIIKLFHASASLEPHFRALLRDISVKDGRPPLCVISDVFNGWSTDVATSCGTVSVTFTTGGAYGTAAYASLWQNLPHRSGNKEYFSLPGFPDSHLFHITQLHHFLRIADGTDQWSRFFQPQIALSLKAFGWLCNTAEEIEPLGLQVLKKYAKLPIWCIGPLLPESMLNDTRTRTIIGGQRTGRRYGINLEKCLQWLGLRPKRSVLYISFGSQNTISPSQMMALALGLEDSKRPFIWVIRPPTGFNLGGGFKPEWLPDGFEERMRNSKQGLVVHDWAPQVDILCHQSTGAFLSHCGWNSSMESLSQGVPMIGWPLAGEQGYNSKMLVEEMGVCVELARGVQQSISREEVKGVIETVLGGGRTGEDMRKKAGEIAELIRTALDEGGRESQPGSSNRAMDEFVSALISDQEARITHKSVINSANQIL